ncbi:MAG: type II secretion system F family protein [Armatimonadetes bacterium]|nr:type II secretion system F family protein [Armatimonadota bacterium]
MAVFSYKVKDGSGHTLTGRLEAGNRREAVASLQGMGYWVLDAREIGDRCRGSSSPLALLTRWFSTPIFGGAPVKALSVYYRQLATMVAAGMSLAQVLDSLGRKAPTGRLSAVSREAARHVQGGGQLSDAFARHPSLFPDIHISLLKAGEAGGSMDLMLNRIADYLEREHALRQRLRMATLYPKMLLLAFIFIPSAPKLVLSGSKEYLETTLPQLIGILLWIGVIWVAYRLLYQVAAFRWAADMLKLVVPGVGALVRMLALSKFYRALGSLYGAGTSPYQAIVRSADACGNLYLARRLREAAPAVQNGGAFTDAMRHAGVMPPLALDMLATGEATGSIPEMMDKVAEFAESESEVGIHRLTMILGVLLILAAGVYIGIQVVGFYIHQYAGALELT